MTSEHKRALGIFLCILGGVYYLQSALFGTVPFSGGLLFAHRNDFGHLYVAGYLARMGGNFFDVDTVRRVAGASGIPSLNPFVYPPFFAMLLIPLSLLTYNAAWFLFSLLSHAAYFLSLSLLVRIFRCEDEPEVFWWGILLAFSAVFDPLMKTYTAGQMNTFLLLLFCAAAYHLSRGRDARAGAMLGLGAAIKVSPGLLFLYLAWKGKWRALLAGTAVLGVTVLISYLYFGPDVHRAFLSEARQMAYGSSTWSQFGQHYHVEPHNQAPSALWYRLFTHNASTTGVVDSPALAKALSYASALLIFLFLLWRTPRFPAPARMEEFGLWTLGLLMIPSLMWDHYLVQGMLGGAAALRLALDGRGRGIGWLALGLALSAVPFAYDLPPFKTGLFTLLMPIRLYGMLLLMGYIAGRDRGLPTPEQEM